MAVTRHEKTTKPNSGKRAPRSMKQPSPRGTEDVNRAFIARNQFPKRSYLIMMLTSWYRWPACTVVVTWSGIGMNNSRYIYTHTHVYIIIHCFWQSFHNLNKTKEQQQKSGPLYNNFRILKLCIKSNIIVHKLLNKVPDESDCDDKHCTYATLS